MDFNEKEITFLKQAKAQGMDKNQAISYVQQKRQQPTQKQGYIDYMKTEAQKTFAPAVGFAQGVSEVGQNIIGKPIERGTRALLEKVTGNKSQSEPITSTSITPILGSQQESFGAKAGEEIGKFAGTSMLMPGGGLAEGATLFSRLGRGAVRGAIQTQVSNIASEGKLAGVGETLLGAGIGTVFQGGGELLAKAKPGLFTKAFSQTQKGLAEKGYELSGKTPGQLVMDQNLKPNVKKGLEQIKGGLQNTWKAVEKTADQAGNFQGASVREGIKADMIKKLGFDKLPQGAKSTKDMIEKVGSIVDDYIPEGNMNGQEIVQQIKNINSTLPNKLIGMGIQDPTSSKGFSQALEKGLKLALDKIIQSKGGNAGQIQALYKEYGQKKLVESILKDENLRKTLGRQLVGMGAGSAIGGVAGYEDFKQGDIISGGLKVLGGAIAGKQAMKAANNPNVLMKMGNILEKAGNKLIPKLQKGATYLASKINK